jgi:hypothetical protein
MTFQTKLLIIHADKVSAENKNFFLTKAWFFTRAYCFETQKKNKKSPYHVPLPDQTILFLKINTPGNWKKFKNKIVLSLYQVSFYFLNAKNFIWAMDNPNFEQIFLSQPIPCQIINKISGIEWCILDL